MKCVSTPCPDCPFSRTCRPGALGGSSPFVYIGQAHAPFALPCHMHCNFSDPDWKAKAGEVAQCAGAAIYRTHVGVAQWMPPEMPRMPANPVVFSSPSEFVAHHMRLPLRIVETRLTAKIVRGFALREWAKARELGPKGLLQ